MRRHITCIAMIAVLGVATSIGYAEDKKSDPKKTAPTPIKVEKTKDGARATYVPKTAGVYVEGGGRQPSHQEPKGEKHAGAGVVYKFGGGTNAKNDKGAAASNGNKSQNDSKAKSGKQKPAA